MKYDDDEPSSTPTGTPADPATASVARTTARADFRGLELETAPAVAAPLASEPTRTSEAFPATALGPSPPRRQSITSSRAKDPERYQILNEHGRGGLGRVSRAHDRELCRDVAIKELISRGNTSEARFLREALITARLEHPGIVPVHEAGRWPDGTPFYAMKLVAGRPLRDLINERTSIDQRIGLIHHVIAVADAIAYAHGRNIIHRDLKPANVIVGDFGETVVIDWGLAKDLSADEEVIPEAGPFRTLPSDDLTSTGAVLGTPAYMAPEQERGEQVDQRADVFAIGAMLWELCSLQKVPPTDLRQRHRMLRASGIDSDLVTIIDKALDRDPARRYRDAGSLAADLKAFKTGARIAARTYSLPSMLAHWTRRHRTLAWSAGSVLVVVAAFSISYVHSITAERDRTSHALQRMEEAKNDLVLEHATSLLSSDPTAALAALEARHGHTELPSEIGAPRADPNVVYTLALKYSLNASRLQRATQVAADALGRGTAAYTFSPNIGAISWIEWSAANKMLIRGTDDKLAEWRLGDKSPDRKISLNAFSHSSTDAHRRWFAYQGSDAVVRLRDLQTGHETDLERLNGTPWDLVVSPVGGHVAAAVSTGDIVLWDRSSRRLRSHSRSPGVYQALRFSPDSSMLAACGRDGTLAVWSVVTGDQIATSQCDGLANIDYQFTQDSKFLIVGYRSGMIEQISLTSRPTSTDRKLGTAVAHGAITEIVTGPNDSMLIGTDTGELVRYDFTSMRVIWRNQLANKVVRATYDSHHNLVFAGCSDGRIAVTTGTGHSMGVLQGHTSGISSISLSKHSRWLASGSADGVVRIWSLPFPAVQSVRIGSTPLFSAKFSSDAELVATEAQDGTVSICTMKTLECTTTVAHESLASGLAWRHDGTTLASTGWDGRLRIWNRVTQESEHLRLSADNGAIYLYDYLKTDRSVLVLLQGKSWQIHDIEDRQIAPLVLDEGAYVSLSADGGRLAVATSSGSLSIWDTSHTTPQLLSTTAFDGATRSTFEVNLSPRGRFAVAYSASGILYLVNISPQGRVVQKTVQNFGAGIPWLASFSPDEEDLAVGYSDGRIVTLRTTTGEQTSYQPFARAVTWLWVSKLRLIGLTREGYIWIYDRRSGTQCVAHVERETISGASLSPDEDIIAMPGESVLVLS